MRRTAEHLVSDRCLVQREHRTHVGNELSRIEQFTDCVQPCGRHIDIEVRRSNAILLLQRFGNKRHRRHQNSPSLESAKCTVLRLAPDGVDDDIDATHCVLDALRGVVHNTLGTQHGEVLPMRGASDRDDVNASVAGQLDGICANIACGPENERGLATRHARVIEQHLPSGDRYNRS